MSRPRYQWWVVGTNQFGFRWHEPKRSKDRALAFARRERASLRDPRNPIRARCLKAALTVRVVRKRAGAWRSDL